MREERKPIWMNIPLILGAICIIILACLSSQIFESNKAGQFIVKQEAISGKMSVIYEEGIFWQLFAGLTYYPRSSTFYFSALQDEGKPVDQTIEVTFRNGSRGKVSGSLRYSYPTSQPDMITLHQRHPGPIAVENDLIRTELRKLVAMTASLMSPEAAMTQKGLFLQMLSDQLKDGQFMTEAAIEEIVDPITKEIMKKDVVNVVKDKDGKPRRLLNPISDMKIDISQVAIQNIQPDNITLTMIEKRRDAEMQIMVAKAKVEQEKQEKLRVEAEGQKDVAQKEYSALQEKMTAVVNAEKEKEVAEIEAKKYVTVNAQKLEAAKLDKQTAEQEKMAQIERGTGIAESRRLVMAADGALEKKLDTYLRAVGMIAEAWKTRPVPQVEMGGKGGYANDIIGLTDMLQVKFAKDLALDMNLGKKGN